MGAGPLGPLTPETVYVNYFDGISDSKTKALMQIFCDLIAKHNPRATHFLFSSTGGSTNAGFTF